MRNLLIFFLLIFTFACSTNSGTERTKNSETATAEEATIPTPEFSNEPERTQTLEPLDSTFKLYLSYLPELELPTRFDCGSSFPNYPEIPSELANKYVEAIFPYRRLPYPDSSIVVTLNLAPSDSELPFINTYKRTGELLNSVNLFPGYCAGGPGFYHTEDVMINELLEITRYDSTWRHETDSLHNKIEGTETFEANISTFTIHADGRITEN